MASLLAGASLTGCAGLTSQPDSAPAARSITCAAGPDCEDKWQKAVLWVLKNTSYPIELQTALTVQTEKPEPRDPKPSFSVKRIPGRDGTHEIVLNGECRSMLGCTPSMAEARAKFAEFVLSAGPAPAADTPEAVAKSKGMVLGIHIIAVPEAMRTGFRTQAKRGILVTSVEEGGVAARAGMMRGDVLVSYDDKPLETRDDLFTALAQTRPGGAVRLAILREGAPEQLSIKFAAPPKPRPASKRRA
jgi:hypothetical protein